jgi:hypothetical protein
MVMRRVTLHGTYTTCVSVDTDMVENNNCKAGRIEDVAAQPNDSGFHTTSKQPDAL